MNTEASLRKTTTVRFITVILSVYTVLIIGLVVAVATLSPAISTTQRAIILMMTTAVILQIIFGCVMYRYRDAFKRIFERIPGRWHIKCIILAILITMIGEAISTTMTNLAPFFGGETGVAFITASTNYFYVILFHSVIIIVPMILTWTFLLSRYDFTPGEVFLLFGLTGTLAESTQAISALWSGYWVFVYGFMMYLPAYVLPSRQVKEPRFFHYVLAVFLPIIVAAPFVPIVIGVRTLLQIPLFPGT